MLRSRTVPKSNLGPFTVGAVAAGFGAAVDDVVVDDVSAVELTDSADGSDDPQAAASRHDERSTDVKHQDFLMQLGRYARPGWFPDERRGTALLPAGKR
jgi:hypothetical protein